MLVAKNQAPKICYSFFFYLRSSHQSIFKRNRAGKGFIQINPFFQAGIVSQDITSLQSILSESSFTSPGAAMNCVLVDSERTLGSLQGLGPLVSFRGDILLRFPPPHPWPWPLQYVLRQHSSQKLESFLSAREETKKPLLCKAVLVYKDWSQGVVIFLSFITEKRQ